MKPLAILGRSKEPVIYEVRLEVDTAIAGDYDDWLRDHVREMLAFPGFQAATVYRGRDLAENGRVVRLAVYAVRSRRELDSYLRTHAPRMRKDGVKRFGSRFAATRRILAAAEYVLPEGYAVLYDQQDISGGLPVCGNCHQPVPGRYCVNCGQEDRTFMLSLRELTYDFIGDTFNFDSRVFRTLWPLLFRPGVLTAEYVRGRRQYYLPPVRMYIFISLIFFFFAAAFTDFTFMDEVERDSREQARDTPLVIVPERELAPEERAEIERTLQATAERLGLRHDHLRLQDATSDENAATAGSEVRPSIGVQDDAGINVSGFGGGDFEERIERGAEALKDDPRAFAQAVLQQIPTMMFVFLPIIAFILKLLYIGSGRYYVEHLIFTLHFHSAVFVLLLLYLAFAEIRDRVAVLEPLSLWVTIALSVYIPVYLYRSLRCVYGQGHFFTMFKYVLLFFSYFFASVFTFAFALVYTMYLQA